MSDARLKEMLKQAVHIGSQASHWSPRMKDFIHTSQNKIHIFDLNKTIKHIDSTKTALEDFCKTGKELLIVGSKIQAQDIAEKLAKDTGHHYVNSVWVPGLLTNFATIKRRINTFNRIAKDIETGDIDKLSKKEKAMQLVEIERLKKRYEGVKDMRRLPDGVLIVDAKYEALAVHEANTVNMTVFSLIGTTGDPDLADHFIPGNVNTVKSLQYIVDQIAPVMKKVKRAPKVPTRRPVANRVPTKPFVKKDTGAPIKKSPEKKEVTKEATPAKKETTEKKTEK